MTSPGTLVVADDDTITLSIIDLKGKIHSYDVMTVCDGNRAVSLIESEDGSHCGQSEDKSKDGDDDRSQHIDEGGHGLAALDQAHGIEGEG